MDMAKRENNEAVCSLTNLFSEKRRETSLNSKDVLHIIAVIFAVSNQDTSRDHWLSSVCDR